MAYFRSLITFMKLIDNNSYLQINDQFRIHSEGSYTQRLLVWRLTTHKYGQMFRPRQIWSSACAPHIKISSHFEGCGWMPNVQLPYKSHIKRLKLWFPLNSRTQDWTQDKKCFYKTQLYTTSMWTCLTSGVTRLKFNFLICSNLSVHTKQLRIMPINSVSERKWRKT